MKIYYSEPYVLIQVGRYKYQVLKQMYQTDMVTYIKVTYNKMHYALGIYKPCEASKRRFEIHKQITDLRTCIQARVTMLEC